MCRSPRSAMPTVPTAQRLLPTWASRADSHHTTDTSRWHSSHSFAQPSASISRSQRGLWPEDTAYAFPSFSHSLCLPCAAQPTREALWLSASCEKSLLPCHLSKRESTLSPRQYFQNNCHALKIFFHALKIFFQGMKKVFQAFEKFFPSTRVFLENNEGCFLRLCVPGSTFKHAPYRLIMW